jgi:hypothetical protein
VISEIALALVLLTGAGLMVKSFLRMRAVDPGFRTENILTMTVDLPDSKYDTATRIQTFHKELLAKLSNMPGAVAAGAVNWMPLQTFLAAGRLSSRWRPQAAAGFSGGEARCQS